MILAEEQRRLPLPRYARVGAVARAREGLSGPYFTKLSFAALSRCGYMASNGPAIIRES